MSTIADKIKSLGLVNAALKDAHSEKGQNPGDTLSTYPDLIRNIETGTVGEDTFSDPNLNWYFHYGVTKGDRSYIEPDQLFGEMIRVYEAENFPGIMVDGKIFTKQEDFKSYYDTKPNKYVFDVKLYYYRTPKRLFGQFLTELYCPYFYFSERCKPIIIESNFFSTTISFETGIEYDNGEIIKTLPDSIISFGTHSLYGVDLDYITIPYESSWKHSNSFGVLNYSNIKKMYFKKQSSSDSDLLYFLKDNNNSYIESLYITKIDRLYGDSNNYTIRKIKNLVFSSDTPPSTISNYYGYNNTSTRTIWCPTGSLDSYKSSFGSSWIIKEIDENGEITTD